MNQIRLTRGRGRGVYAARSGSGRAARSGWSRISGSSGRASSGRRPARSSLGCSISKAASRYRRCGSWGCCGASMSSRAARRGAGGGAAGCCSAYSVCSSRPAMPLLRRRRDGPRLGVVRAPDDRACAAAAVPGAPLLEEAPPRRTVLDQARVRVAAPYMSFVLSISQHRPSFHPRRRRTAPRPLRANGEEGGST